MQKGLDNRAKIMQNNSVKQQTKEVSPVAYKKGFFPWIKSIFHKEEEEPQPIDLVYNGPEIKNPEKPVIKKRPAAECVYAGPEYFNESTPFTEKVYAGPEYSEKKAPPTEEPPEIPPQPVDMPVYAGPEYFNPNDKQNPPAGAFFAPSQEEDTVPEEEPVSKELYAGPEYLRKLRGDPEEPEKPAANDDPVFEEVYAGPEFYEWDPNGTPEEDAPLPPEEEEISLEEAALRADKELEEKMNAPVPDFPPRDPITMMTYAGPAYYAQQQPIPPQPPRAEPAAVSTASADGAGVTKCPACGAARIGNSKFCHECGTPYKDNE